jgi:hypothetical protein
MGGTTGADDKRINAVLERLAKIHEPYSRYKHPLWSGLMEGRFERPQVKEFIRQAGIIPLFNHLYHGPLYVTDMKHRPAVLEARRAFFTGDFPCSTLVAVTALIDPRLLVEINAVVFIGASA